MKAVNVKRLPASLLFLFLSILSFFFIPYPLSLIPPANADPPVKFTYQGNLRQSGILVTGNRTMKFHVYSSSWSETALWSSPDYAVSVSTGVFRVILEPSISPADWNGAELWLEMEVETVKLSPRELITSGVYSINALLHSGKKYTTSSSDPPGPTSGDLWYDSAINALKFWNGSVWMLTSGGEQPGDNLGNHIATTTLNMNSWDINNVSTVTFLPNVYISSASADKFGGVYVSTHIYSQGGIHATKFYGDGSGLTGIIGDNLGNHDATQRLNMANFPIMNVSSMSINGANVTGTNPLFTVSGSAMVVLDSGNVGIGTNAPQAKLEVDGTDVSGGYMAIYKSGSKIAAWLRNK